MHKAYVGLGSNLDGPAGQLRAALDDIAAIEGVTHVQPSRLYQTPPWGVTEQPDFVNAVASLHTSLSPESLLAQLQALERRSGRSRAGLRWGPRRLDLDLLLYDDWVSTDASVQVPHPRMMQRAFVLVPLAELAPQLHIPGHGSLQELLASLDPQERAAVVALEPSGRHAE